jgi:hypothetical protein
MWYDYTNGIHLTIHSGKSLREKEKIALSVWIEKKLHPAGIG